MVRRTGSYESIIRGVSEQVPQDRRIGQHSEQVNMISDPVRGNARRQGSRLIHEVVRRAYTAPAWDNMATDTAAHKTYPFQNLGSDYDLIYRTRESAAQAREDFALCFNKDTGTWVPTVLQSGSAFLDQIISGGVSAVTAVGRYLFIAGNSTVTSFTGVDETAAMIANMAAWVRGGGYARTYSITLIRRSGAQATYTYKTPTSSYPGTLDTSDIPITIPDPANPTGPEIPNEQYQKLVNDRVNDYNTAVTQWIGTSAAAIVPTAIAESLMQVVKTATGWSSSQIGRVDSTIVFNTGTDPDPAVELSCADGGDGTLFRGVGAEITSIDMVSAVHYPGKVVKVRPKKNNGTDVFYLKAYPRAGSGTGPQEVTWRESSGFTTTPTNFCALATIIGGTLYIAADAAGLTAMAGGTHPSPVPSGVGDRTSNPMPTFLGRRIDYLGMFQDRLVVCAGAVAFFSRTGDYQNFFRQSVLLLDDSDPVEMFSLGAEDDTIRAGTTYDRNLLLFGKRKQYVVSGRQPLTPKNASIVVQSGHEDAVDSFPINSGNFVFYNKFRNGRASTHQIQIGQLVDSPESYEVSKQLDRYLKGRPVELVAVTSPNVLFLRTETQRDRVYVYTYLDTAAGGERLFDSWSSWVTAPAVGAIIGLSRHEGDLMVYYMRHTGTNISVAADRFVIDTDLSAVPYFDSYRPYADVLPGVDPAAVSVAYGNERAEYLLGAPWARRMEVISEYGTAALYTGFNFPAYLTPTNPYILDQNGKAIMSGRLTTSNINVSVADSSGMVGTVTTRFGDKVSVNWNGRAVGSTSNLVGVVPITTTSLSLVVGREVRDYAYTLAAKTWLPLTVTALEWSGQFFNNNRRG